MKILNTLLSLLIIVGAVSSSFGTTLDGGANLGNPYEAEFVVAQDTVPINERYGDFINDPSSNPFDLKDPGIIEKEVEYDPTTGQYIVTEKIGNEYYRMPTYMTFEEYLDYRAKEQEQSYFNQLSGVNTGDGSSGGGEIDPVAKYEADIKNSLIDRLFGGSDVQIKPQGKIELTFGVDFQRNNNPVLLERQQRTGGFDFDMNIQMNVTGKIGEKLNLSTSYNTQATFDFENRMKLQYDSEAFGEDDIIKNIDVGNISFPLKSSLIQGSQNLFGIRIDSKWGRLSLSTVASQQKSRRESLSLQKGSQIQEFEVRADQYEENRHFFLTHYNRNTFTENLSNLPQVKSLFKVNPAEIEVWITNTQNANIGSSVREIIALADIGVAERENMTSDNPALRPPPVPVYRDVFGAKGLPDNNANPIHASLAADEDARRLETSISTLTGPRYQLQQAKDFEKITAVKMNPGDYTFNPELGILSINRIIQPDQVLAVAFQYDYNGKIYKVGEFANDIYDTTGTQVLFVKMLKSTTQRIDLPAWDLMMKNVYNIGAYQVDRNDFKLDIYYEDPSQGQLRFLPNTNLEGIPLLRVFNLDQLNVQGDPCPDGVFDFVNGITIQPRNGRIMFPVLEPFGADLVDSIRGADDKKQYNYFHLYDSTVTQAREHPEFNRFIIRGEYKSGGGGGRTNSPGFGGGGNTVTGTGQEISLGAFNLPRGSVRVTAGGRQLREGTDFRVDYSTGRVAILDPALANGTTPINVSYEDNTLFGFQTKTLLGVRADYEVSDNFNVGATWMHLFERPFTQKVNIGDDPINNTVYGLDINYSKDAPWLTRAVDKLPFLQTKEPSTITFEAEAALLQPGHSKAINQDNDGDGKDERGGVVYVDDFEGTTSSIDLRTPANRWYLASIPQNDIQNNNPLFPESAFIDTTLSGVNRAKLSWYRMDFSIPRDNTKPYEALIPQIEVFPNTTVQPGFSNNIQTFDLTYYPDERGPYNFDLPNGGTQYSAGLSNGGRLMDPESRWGGIMRSLNTNDFQAANIEFIELWMLDPFLDDNANEGDLYFNLGNISEDILRDSRKFYENGLPTSSNESETQTTALSRVPVSSIAAVDAFSNGDDSDRMLQDVGLDGFNNAGERTQFRDILDIYRSTLPGQVFDRINEDPSADDFVHYRNDIFPDDTTAYSRYSSFNNPEGNSQPPEGNRVNSGTNFPDNEDIDDDNTMNETEAYFQYKIPLRRVDSDSSSSGYALDWRNNEFVTDVIRDSLGSGRVWYRFKIPLDQYQAKVGGIQDFRSIRFMRMYLKGFQGRTTLRFARLELVRNQWRRYRRALNTQERGLGPNVNDLECDDAFFDLNAVNIEENSKNLPFGYVLPPGIQREQANNTAFPDLLQNEQSLAVEVRDLCEDQARAVYKIVNLDMRLYNRLQMFVHAHAGNNDQFLEDDKLSVFMRLGSDFENNYYEYEVPLKISRDANLGRMSAEYAQEVWKIANEFDIPLDKLKEAKLARNNSGTPLTNVYSVIDTVIIGTDTIKNKIRVLGNPYLGPLKSIMLGIVNRDNIPHDAEVWFNELRLSGLDERGGMAAIARLDMQLADLGTLTGAIEYKGIGYGGIEERLAQRSREETIQLDASTSLEMGKFLPKESGVKIPMYLQYSKTIRNPEFDPYDRDIRLSEKLESVDPSLRDSVKNQAQEVTEIKSINFTNVRKDRTNTEKTPMPWNIENFSTSYSYTETKKRDPFIEDDRLREHSGALNYTYSRGPSYITPFKNLFKKDKYLKLITDFNFNPLPNSFSFNTNVNRQHQVTKYRFTDLDERFSTFYNKSFVWERNYDLKWDFTKALKFNFAAFNYGVIDELKELREDGTPRPKEELKSYIWENVKDFGRTKEYNHNIGLSYTVPLKKIPMLDWIQVRAQYDADYSWTTAALNTDSLGNVIQNSQGRQINGDFNFESLYKKSKYLSKIQRKKRPNKGRNGKNNRGGRNSKKGGDSKTDSSLDDGGSGKSSKNSKSKDDNKKQATLEKAGGNKGQESADPKDGTADGGGEKLSKKEKRAAKAKAKKEKKKKDREPGTLEKVLIRPLLMIRKVRMTYSEDFTTVVPGYLPRTSFLGQNDGFTAPGWDFIAGLQPDIAKVDGQNDWLDRANSKGWISSNVFQNQQVLQDKSQNISARLTLEPFDDFMIELSAERRQSTNSSVYFRDTSYLDGIANPVHSIPRDVGSFSISYFALNTLFGTDAKDLFNTFERNRLIISRRIGGGDHATDEGYAEGYGRAQQDVLLPAFIAAYTDQDPFTIELSSNNYLKDVILKELPRINWQLKYNGLSKLPWFSDYFTSFDLTHGYKSSLTVNSYNTDQDFDQAQITREDMNFNFYSQFEVPNLIIDEQFAPLLAIDFKLKNEMSGNIGYSKSRNLQMNFKDTRLAESTSEEIILGFGYTMKDVVFGFLQKGGASKKNKKKKGKKKDDPKSSGKKKQEGGNLNFDFQFSITDSETSLQRLDQGDPEPARGSKDITISPAIDYDVNDKLNIRFFFDRNQFLPANRAQPDRITTNGGITVTFQIN